MDLTTVLIVMDTKPAVRPANQGTARPEDMGYRTLLMAFHLRDLLHLLPVPQGIHFCLKGAARSRIITVVCHSEAQFTILSYHSWGSTLLSDQHIPLLFTVAFLVIGLDKPSLNTVSRTPQYHFGAVAQSPADTADFRGSVLRRRVLDPQLAPDRWLKGLQRAIFDWAHATRGVQPPRFPNY